VDLYRKPSDGGHPKHELQRCPGGLGRAFERMSKVSSESGSESYGMPVPSNLPTSLCLYGLPYISVSGLQEKETRGDERY
jgi:hypothetical protein